jgi:glycogen operon protein
VSIHTPPASAAPLGAFWDGAATTFRIQSRHATGITLELEYPELDAHRIPLARIAADAWEVTVSGAAPGTRYAYRVDGPWDPRAGHLFNPAKLVLDPWARLIDGPLRWHPALRVGRHEPGGLLARDPDDSAPYLPRAVVAEPWTQPPRRTDHRRPWRDTVIYECHVKGMTALHPGVPPHLRGTYAGLASDAIIEHLNSLGVTAVELLPVHPATDNAHLVRSGLTNYWGYASVAFFAPDRRLASVPGRELTEFRAMVAALHAAGLEVILDVVYNHTGEGSIDGCTATFRGLDNTQWYRISDGGGYEDVTGCGNTLDFRQPGVRRLVRDSLACWAGEGVDGFRFDLAPTLARTGAGGEILPSFLEELRDDPALQGCRLIAEPWDLGPDGYQQGRFPLGWAEWNGRYRDGVRRFWRGSGSVAELATRISGSSDLFAPSGRTPEASINFVTCHDGFTLLDLVCYARKHNVANGEGNRDGADWSESQNFGVEGPTASPEVTALRERTMRNLVATLAFSLGVPMLSHGDEHGRTQSGNNNPWCQDNALAWMPWHGDARARRMEAFVRQVLALRRRYGVFRRTAFLHVQDTHDARAVWLTRHGREMRVEDWQDPANQLLVVALQTGVEDGPVEHAWVLLLLNGHADAVEVALPDGLASRWTLVLSTAERPMPREGTVLVPARAVLLLEGAAG